MTYENLKAALALFGLEQRAGWKEIKARHRQLVKRYHPDNLEEQDQEMMRKVNAAYAIIREYVEGYRFSFAEEEFYEQNPEERLRWQFMDDPLWGAK